MLSTLNSNDELANDELITKPQETNKKYDLEERTARFGEVIIAFCRKIKETYITKPLVGQLIRSGTSIGANYCEANDALSKNDFVHKLGIARRESKETTYWLRMICLACPETKDETIHYRDEAHQLNLIFSSIINKIRGKNR